MTCVGGGPVTWATLPLEAPEGVLGALTVALRLHAPPRQLLERLAGLATQLAQSFTHVKCRQDYTVRACHAPMWGFWGFYALGQCCREPQALGRVPPLPHQPLPCTQLIWRLHRCLMRAVSLPFSSFLVLSWSWRGTGA